MKRRTDEPTFEYLLPGRQHDRLGLGGVSLSSHVDGRSQGKCFQSNHRGPGTGCCLSHSEPLDGNATNFDRKCVEDCVKGGSPLVILTQDGRLYFPLSARMPDTDQRKELMPFVGKYVRASGVVFERTGTHAIVITEIKEMKEVRLTIDEE